MRWRHRERALRHPVAAVQAVSATVPIQVCVLGELWSGGTCPCCVHPLSHIELRHAHSR
jgi:hypothetical protein